MAIRYTLGELAERLGLELRGDAGLLLQGVATLADAGPGQLSFLANPRYRSQLAGCRASALVLAPEDLPRWQGAALVTSRPYVAFARLAALFEPLPAPRPGVHPSAWVEAGAEIEASAEIGPFCSIAAGARIGSGAILGPGCIIGPECVVGAQSRLVARVTLVTRVRLGQRVLVHPGAVLGADGFGLAFDRERWIKVPQLGGVLIGDDCEIGANTTIDRGALGDTVLEEDVRLDNQIQIAHNVHIGAHTAVAGCAAVAGSARIGRRCLIGGGAGILGHLTIADGVIVTAMSLVTQSIDQPGEYSSSWPAQRAAQWRRNAARLRQLDAMAERLKNLEKDPP